MLHVGRGGFRVRERRFALRVLLERDVNRLLKGQRRRLLCLLREAVGGRHSVKSRAHTAGGANREMLLRSIINNTFHVRVPS